SSHQVTNVWQENQCAIEGADSATDVRDRDTGGNRRENHCARQREGSPKGRDCKVLRRRYLAKAKAAGEAERGEEANEAGGICGDTAGGLPGRALDGGVGVVERNC